MSDAEMQSALEDEYDRVSYHSDDDDQDEDDDDLLDDDELMSDEGEEEDDEDEDDDYGDHDDTYTAEKPRCDYEVDFRVLSPADIQAMQDQDVQDVMNVLGESAERTTTLLRHFKWNKDRLVEQFLDAREKVLHEVGIVTVVSEAPRILPAPAGFCCEICYDDEPDMPTLALRCQHRFCVACYQQYLTQKVMRDGESRRIQCAATDCRVIIDEGTVQLLAPPNIYTRYRTLLTRTFVDDHAYLRWCPAPNCEYVVQCNITNAALASVVPTVQCRCGFAFCHGCGLEDHLPCICDLVKNWLRKCADDSETSNWIHVNTKECIKCHSTIEKNGGCNHMTCRKCSHEFCWVCQGPWSEHGSNWYSCNRFEESSSRDARDSQAKSRQQLERYLHYYNRYANHDRSARLDKELHAKTERKMEEMQQSSVMSWIEVQFLRDAVDKLFECRMTLKWTYAFAYYLARNNQTELFENNQRDLEMAVEQLSGMLEQPIDPEHLKELKQRVLDKTNYVARRREVLLNDTAIGHAQERWAYNVDL